MNTPHRIEIHGQGVGIADDALVERRAEELARIDGRSAAAQRDYLAARRELVRQAPPGVAPEGQESLQSWDEAPEANGSHRPRVAPDDETSPVELLIEEGLNEADHDTRVAASKAP